MSIVPSPPPRTAQPRDPEPNQGPPIKMKMRGDLTFDLQSYQGVEYWVIKEPLGQKYYQFPPHVFFILQQLDGKKSIDEIIDNYHTAHSPKRITRTELQQLLMRFHRDGLVISDMPGQGTELLERGRKNVSMERFSAMSNILAIRYRGFDPEAILNWLNRWTWWIFTKPCVMVVCMFATIALLSVLMNMAEFQARLPGFEQFFDPRKWFMFGAVLAITKVFHEFGHGLSCKRLGGECHEIGFMLLVLTPCLYCNVSDSWRLNNKWHRAAIGAAGIYVEIILATIATFIWWFVQPGIVQEVCLQVMLICSISTVLFNGNPLLRFDGYYIMSDLLEIPNLQQKSSKALTTLLGRHWLGLEIPDDQLMPSNRPWAFALFTVAAFLYRWFILFAIVTFLMVWLEPYGLETVGIGIAMFAAVGILVFPSYKLYKYMSVPGRMHQVKKARFFGVLAGLVGVLVLVFGIPFPTSLRCSAIVVPSEMQTVYVQQEYGGILEGKDSLKVHPGDEVVAGAELAVLSNPQLNIALNDTQSELKQKEEQRDALIRSAAVRTTTTDYMKELPTIEKEIVSLKKQLAELEDQKDLLVLKSQIDGTVLETPFQHSGPQSEEIPLINPQPLLTGGNVNVGLSYQQRFCEIANLKKWEAVVLLTEDQIKFADEAFQDGELYVRIKLDLDPSHVIRAKVDRLGVSDRSIDRDDFNADPSKASQNALPDLVAEMVAGHQQGNIQYFAKVSLPMDDPLIKRTQLKIGLGGQARVEIGNRSLGAKVYTWFNQNFRF